jgi:hypothetical protein
MFGFLIFGGISSGEAGIYLGNYCWLIRTTNTDIVDITLRLGISEEYAEHYVVNGKAEYPERAAVGMANGNAEIVGDNIILGLEIIASDAYGTWYTFFNTMLDLDLNGTFTGVQNIYDFSDLDPRLVYITGTFTLIPCP